MTSAAEILRKACSQTGVSLSEVARRTGQLPSTLSRKLSRNTMSFAELQKCLSAVGISINLGLDSLEAGNCHTDDQMLEERLSILEAQHNIDKKNLEFHMKLVRDIRSAIDGIEGYRTMALNHSGEQLMVEKYLKKIGKAVSDIDESVSHSLGEHKTASNNDYTCDFSVLKGKKVLLADDNEINREIYNELLTEFGLVVFEAKNGFETLAQITAAEPAFFDYLVLEMELPIMGGCETARRIRALPNRLRANIPIIAATVNSSSETRLEAIEAGFDEFLVKPINTRQLLSIFCKYI